VNPKRSPQHTVLLIARIKFSKISSFDNEDLIRMKQVEVKLGRNLFGKEERIQELTRDNVLLTQRLEELGSQFSTVSLAYKELNNTFNRERDSSQIASLEFEQMRLENLTLNSKLEKIQQERDTLKHALEEALEKTKYLGVEQDHLIKSHLVLDSEKNRMANDIKVFVLGI